ncbi:MAG: hypothetical protein ACK5W7_14210, partial [Gemmatimonadaceae bacterium]
MLKRVSHKLARRAAVAMAALVTAAVSARPIAAQEVAGRCTVADSIAVRGHVRVDVARIRTEAGLTPGAPLHFPTLQRASEALYPVGEF